MRAMKKHAVCSGWGHQIGPREQEALDTLTHELSRRGIREADVISVRTEILTKEREVFDEHCCKATAIFWSDS